MIPNNLRPNPEEPEPSQRPPDSDSGRSNSKAGLARSDDSEQAQRADPAGGLKIFSKIEIV